MLNQVAQSTAPDGLPFQVFTLTNSQQMAIQVTDWGATWLSCQVPVGAENALREVLLGCQLADCVGVIILSFFNKSAVNFYNVSV